MRQYTIAISLLKGTTFRSTNERHDFARSALPDDTKKIGSFSATGFATLISLDPSISLHTHLQISAYPRLSRVASLIFRRNSSKNSVGVEQL